MDCHVLFHWDLVPINSGNKTQCYVWSASVRYNRRGCCLYMTSNNVFSHFFREQRLSSLNNRHWYECFIISIYRFCMDNIHIFPLSNILQKLWCLLNSLHLWIIIYYITSVNVTVIIFIKILFIAVSPPIIHTTGNVTDMYKRPGDSVSIRCQVYGNPSPSVRWSLAGQPLVISSVDADRVKVS